MPTPYERPSAREDRLAEQRENDSREAAARGRQDIRNLARDLWDDARADAGRMLHRFNAGVDRFGEGVQDTVHGAQQAVDNTVHGVQRAIDETARGAQNAVNGAVDGAIDTYVRAGHDIHERADQLRRRDFPEEYSKPVGSSANNQAPRHDAPERAPQHSEHTRVADATGHPNHEHSVRHGERPHAGSHKPRHEHVTAKALINRHGETVLPDMQIYYD